MNKYFGHLMQRADSLEKTLMLGKTEGRMRRRSQSMRWLDGITNHESQGSRPPDSSAPGILQARILERMALSLTRGLLNSGTEPVSLALAGDS